MNGEEALAKLMEGNSRFVGGVPIQKDLVQRRSELLAGQEPIAVVVTCSDSRVVPEYIFDVGLGDIFTVISAGNVLDKIGIGSVEYAVGHLHTPLVIVLGHEKCGAVTAAYDAGHAGPNVAAIVKKIAPSVKKAKKGGEKHTEVEHAAVLNVKAMIRKIKKAPEVKDALEKGQIKIVGMKYGLDGKVEVVAKG
jgi:carbonic anhydrase